MKRLSMFGSGTSRVSICASVMLTREYLTSILRIAVVRITARLCWLKSGHKDSERNLKKLLSRKNLYAGHPLKRRIGAMKKMTQKKQTVSKIMSWTTRL